MTMLAAKSAPTTVKLCWADAVPKHAEKADNVPEVVIDGKTQFSVSKLSEILFETPHVGSVYVY